MPNAHVKVPSAWRIIRAHLAVRESSTFNDIYQAVKQHRPNYNKKRFENKLTHMRTAGIIANAMKLDANGDPVKAQRGVYRLTQAGRVDYTDPVEIHGLPEHDGTTNKSKAQIERAQGERAQQPGTNSGNHRDSKPKRSGANLVKARAKLKELRDSGTLEYRKKPGRPRTKPATAKTSRVIDSRAQQPAGKPKIIIAGRPTEVDSELIERLLNAARPQQLASPQLTNTNGEQELIVPFSTDIRLKLRVVVELA